VKVPQPLPCRARLAKPRSGGVLLVFLFLGWITHARRLGPQMSDQVESCPSGAVWRGDAALYTTDRQFVGKLAVVSAISPTGTF
jgi:hypothetical protein